MSAIKRLIEDVLELYNERYSIAEISDILRIPTIEIRTIIDEYAEEYAL